MTSPIVLDTNILVSALISPDGNPARIFNMVSENLIKTIYCQEILNEYMKVLKRPRFQFPASLIAEALDIFILFGIYLQPVKSNVPMTDESDRVFHDIAITGSAILITGNLKHYPTEPFILSPADYLAFCS